MAETLASFLQPPLLIEAAITRKRKEQEGDDRSSVSCGLCVSHAVVLSFFFFCNPQQTLLYSHNTSKRLGGVLSKTKNDEQDLTGYKTRREQQHKTISHRPFETTAIDNTSIAITTRQASHL